MRPELGGKDGVSITPASPLTRPVDSSPKENEIVKDTRRMSIRLPFPKASPSLGTVITLAK